VCALELRLEYGDIRGGMLGVVDSDLGGDGHRLIDVRSLFYGSFAEDDWA
tara:strand:- start:279 stop:428 length:150 start_codon:yes stop_codon:yes gene_type:complete